MTAFSTLIEQARKDNERLYQEHQRLEKIQQEQRIENAIKKMCQQAEEQKRLELEAAALKRQAIEHHDKVLKPEAMRNFNASVAALNNSIDTKCPIKSQQALVLQELISQAKALVSAEAITAVRIHEVNTILGGLNAFLNGEPISQKALYLISDEIDKSSIFDKKTNRILAGSAKVFGGILIAAVLIAIASAIIYGLATNTIPLNTDTEGMSVIVFMSLAMGLFGAAAVIRDGINDIFYKQPASIGTELSQFSIFSDSHPAKTDPIEVQESPGI